MSVIHEHPARIHHQSANATGVYGLTQDDFGQLFTGKDEDHLQQVICDLKNNIMNTSNNEMQANGIELLHNMALRNDNVGYQAEKTLVELFKQPDESEHNLAISQQITQTSLQLVTMKQSRVTDMLNNANRLTRPSAILYMAGCSPAVSCETKENIISIIKKGDAEETAATFWDRGRLVTDEELLIAGERISAQYQYPDISINAPLALLHGDKTNQLIDILKEKLKHKIMCDVEFFPVNTGMHWVLTAIYPDPDGNKKMAVFSSMPLSKETKNHFIECSSFISKSTNITIIDNNLQQYVPNGCGLFVDSAMQHICRHRKEKNQDIANALQEFSADMGQKTAEDLTQFNLICRKKLLADRYLAHNRPDQA